MKSKKSMKSLCGVLIIVLALLIGNITFAQEEIRVEYNGDEVTFDVNPFLKDGRTMVPFRKVFEVLGADVSWDSSTNTVTAVNGLTEIKLQVGSKNATVNGKNIILDVPPMIINGRTVVPLRFVSENCGAQVEWDSASKTVYISTQGMTCH
jgi:hypothetical protein